MGKRLITSEGLMQMARIFVSCRPIMGEIMTPNQRYLIGKAKSGEGIDFDLFIKDLPMVDDTYDNIMGFANDLGKNDIDEEVVWKFFGGEPHFKKVIGQLRELKVKEEYRNFLQRILFAHMLVPATVVSVSPISAKYENGNIAVDLRNIISTIKDAEVKIGQKYLVHYASIVADQFSEEIENYLLKVQSQNVEFVDACRKTKSIDYDQFWGLCEWTKDIVEERGLLV